MKDFLIQFLSFALLEYIKILSWQKNCEIFLFSFSVLLNSVCFFLMHHLIHSELILSLDCSSTVWFRADISVTSRLVCRGIRGPGGSPIFLQGIVWLFHPLLSHTSIVRNVDRMNVGDTALPHVSWEPWCHTSMMPVWN